MPRSSAGVEENLEALLSEPVTDQAPQTLSFDSVVERFGIDPDTVAGYLQEDERLTGFGGGGSESLVMFVQSPVLGSIVRKVCAEDLSSVGWDPDGTGVMTPPSTKGGLQVQYLQGLPKAVRPYFPQVHDVRVHEEAGDDGKTKRKLVYDQTFLAGSEVSTYVAEAQPSPEVVTHLHAEIMRLLAERVHPHRETLNEGDSIEPSYLTKIESRLELCRDAAPETFGPLLDADRIVINGKDYPNITELLTFFRQPAVTEMLEPKYHSLVMGDTNTENIMITDVAAMVEAMQQPGTPEFTYDDIGLRFFDPRSIGHDSVGAQTRDDRMYDNKPVHNTLGNYDVIHGEYFSIAVDNRADGTPRVTLQNRANNPYTAPYDGLDKSDYFKKVMDGWNVSHPDFQRDDPNWLLRFSFMMGTHFAAMPPFHFTRNEEGVVPEDAQAQKRAIAIYCEGIKWLTAAREMVEGQRQELYCVPLVPLQPSARQ